MNYKIKTATNNDATDLANIRVAAMKESLEAISRFDPTRARDRFLQTFQPELTKIIYSNQTIMGFYVIEIREDHWYLAHFYLSPEFQGKGIGGNILTNIQQDASFHDTPIRLGALRESKSNHFYQRHGFIKTEEDEWDIYYEWQGTDSL